MIVPPHAVGPLLAQLERAARETRAVCDLLAAIADEHEPRANAEIRAHLTAAAAAFTDAHALIRKAATS